MFIKTYTYKDLIVWQKSMDLVVAVYELTIGYPNSELYGLVVHTRKTAVSIPSNIAEGRRRGSKKDYRSLISCPTKPQHLLPIRRLHQAIHAP